MHVSLSCCIFSDEVDVIPCLQCQEEQKTDGDPIVVVHHKLGIKSWCVKHLYLFAYKKLLKGKKDFPLTGTCLCLSNSAK